MSESIFSGKKILITGGSGHMGKHLTKRLLEYDVDTIRILSRGELKQVLMTEELGEDERLRFLIGDVRDRERLEMAVKDVDIVYALHALKHADICERNPFEAVATNIMGTQNLIQASINEEVEKFIFLDTDKSVSPHLLYGKVKNVANHLTISANFYKGKIPSIFSSARYGNVWASSGAVQNKWYNQILNNNKITLTDDEMTRFNISVKDALQVLIDVTELMCGAEIFVPKLKTYKLKDLAEAMIELYGNKNTEIEIIGNRGYEKTHEVLISEYELDLAYDIGNMYVIFPNHYLIKRYGLVFRYPCKPKKLDLTSYTSRDAEHLTVEELKCFLKNTFN